MKRSAIQYVAGFVGATLIIVGVVWTCRQLSSPTQLNAAPPTPETTGVRPIRSEKPTSSLALSSTPTTSVRQPNEAPSPIRPTSGSSVRLSLLDDEAPIDAAPTQAETQFVAAQPLTTDETPAAPQPLNVDETPANDAFAPGSFPNFDSEFLPFDEPAPLAPESLPLDSQTLDSASLETQTPAPQALETTPLVAPLSNGDGVDALAPAPAVEYVASVPDASSTSTLKPLDDAVQPQFDDSPLANLPTLSEPAGSGVPGDAALEGPQTTQVVVEKIVPAEIQVDVEATFVVKVKNLGASVARNVVLRDSLPSGARFVSAEPAIVPTAQGEFVWNSFDLEPQREKTFEYRIVPTREGEIGSVATVSFNAEASCKVRCVKPELKVEVVVANQATLGDNLDFEFVVSNVGSGAATGVALLETIPEGLFHPSGSVLDNKLGTLQPGESKRLPLTLRCAAPGTTVNKLVVTADGGIERKVDTEIKILAPALELEIVGSQTLYLERPTLYRLKVKNVGDAAAKDVKLVAEIPDGTTFVSANNLGAYKEAVRSVYWDLAELPIDAEGEIELVLTGTKISESQLTFGGSGPNDLTAQVAQNVAVDGLPALSFAVKTSNDPVEVGGEIEYEAQIVNRGTKASTNVLLQIALPNAMKIVSTDGPSQPANRGGTLVFDKIPEIPAKSSVVVKIKATSAEIGDCRVSFQLSSDDLEPLVKEENIRVYR